MPAKAIKGLLSMSKINGDHGSPCAFRCLAAGLALLLRGFPARRILGSSRIRAAEGLAMMSPQSGGKENG